MERFLISEFRGVTPSGSIIRGYGHCDDRYNTLFGGREARLSFNSTVESLPILLDARKIIPQPYPISHEAMFLHLEGIQSAQKYERTLRQVRISVKEALFKLIRSGYFEDGDVILEVMSHEKREEQMLAALRMLEHIDRRKAAGKSVNRQQRDLDAFLLRIGCKTEEVWAYQPTVAN